HALPVRAFDEKLRAVLAAELAEGSRRRAEHTELSFSFRLTEPLHDIRGIVERARERTGTDDDVDERQERRVPHGPSKVQLAFVECRVVLLTRELDAVVLGMNRLDDGFAWPIAPP